MSKQSTRSFTLSSAYVYRSYKRRYKVTDVADGNRGIMSEEVD